MKRGIERLRRGNEGTRKRHEQMSGGCERTVSKSGNKVFGTCDVNIDLRTMRRLEDRQV